MPPKTATVPHLGRKVERIRMLRGIKQETLASQIGLSQSTLSKLEQSETIDDAKLKLIADALGVSVDTIKNFNEENAIYNIQNNYDSSTNNINYQNNPVDKIVELYERLLESERQKVAILEGQLMKKK